MEPNNHERGQSDLLIHELHQLNFLILECLDISYRLGVERQKREFRKDVIRIIMKSVVISAGFFALVTLICYVLELP